MQTVVYAAPFAKSLSIWLEKDTSHIGSEFCRGKIEERFCDGIFLLFLGGLQCRRIASGANPILKLFFEEFCCFPEQQLQRW